MRMTPLDGMMAAGDAGWVLNGKDSFAFSRRRNKTASSFHPYANGSVG
jgi:hypothetical protein